MSDLTNRRSYMLVTNTEIVLVPWPISTTKTKLELKFCFSNTLFRILLKKNQKKKKPCQAAVSISGPSKVKLL